MIIMCMIIMCTTPCKYAPLTRTMLYTAVHANNNIHMYMYHIYDTYIYIHMYESCTGFGEGRVK